MVSPKKRDFLSLFLSFNPNKPVIKILADPLTAKTIAEHMD